MDEIGIGLYLFDVGLDLIAGKAEAALAGGVLPDVGVELFGGVSGPVCGGYNQFGICGLIEEEVAQAHVAAGAYHEVGVGHSGGGEFGSEDVVGDVVGV